MFKDKKIELKKLGINDGKDVYNFLVNLGVGENGFENTPPKNIDEFKILLKKYWEESEGIDLRPNRVAQTRYWLYVNEEIVGMIKIRTELTEYLSRVGGHIGYMIDSKYRGHGYGKLILKEGLKMIKTQGIDRVLVTCNEDNLRSRRVIESNGGKLFDIDNSHCRYWIKN